MAAELLTLRVVRASPLDAVCDAFLLDREASRCTPKTLEHDQYTVGTFRADWALDTRLPGRFCP